MESNSLKQAQRELDRFLRPLPERLRELFGTVQYDAALKKLEEAEDPSPEWVAAQLRSLRVKAQTIRAAVSELSEKLTALLNRYIDAGGTDALRIAHAREELLFLQKTLDDQAAQAARLEQLKQSTALLLVQKDQMDALELARLRQKLGKRERQ
jgi:hypothetical protein